MGRKPRGVRRMRTTGSLPGCRRRRPKRGRRWDRRRPASGRSTCPERGAKRYVRLGRRPGMSAGGSTSRSSRRADYQAPPPWVNAVGCADLPARRRRSSRGPRDSADPLLLGFAEVPDAVSIAGLNDGHRVARRTGTGATEFELARSPPVPARVGPRVPGRGGIPVEPIPAYPAQRAVFPGGFALQGAAAAPLGRFASLATLRCLVRGFAPHRTRDARPAPRGAMPPPQRRRRRLPPRSLVESSRGAPTKGAASLRWRLREQWSGRASTPHTSDPRCGLCRCAWLAL